MNEAIGRTAKKIWMGVLAVVLLSCTFMLAGCGNESNGAGNQQGEPDVDLTKLSSTMVYSEVYNMVSAPKDYDGKLVRARGAAASTRAGSKTYYAVIISDATACCSQGLEYELSNKASYPKDGTEIVVEGVFGTYKEGNKVYCVLRNAKVDYA